MNHLSRSTPRSLRRAGFTILELLVVVAIILILAALSFQVMKSIHQKANLARATGKISDLGAAFVGYTADSGGLLPMENFSGSGDGWDAAEDPAAQEVWYNALPASMGSRTVGEISEANQPEAFYDDSYPIFVPGAPYPAGEKKYKKPMYAIGMNSRLQRTDDETGIKERGTLVSIQVPINTVVFLERGMPKDKKIVGSQANFTATPKASPKAFAGRHNQKGLLLFADGHVEVRSVLDLLTPGGEVIIQEGIIWTRDPLNDPN